MVMRINHNLAAFNTYRQMGNNQVGQAKSLEKLSSGMRINRAGDDAAGLAISEKMRGQIRGLNQAARNSQDAISMIQTAEGGLNEVHDILQRMRELAVQASNSTLVTEDRESVGEELVALKAEIDRIADDTEFNGKSILDGSLSTSLDATNSDINIGTVISTDTLVISSVDVSSAAAGTTFTLIDADDAITLSDGTTSQTISLTTMSTGVAQTLNFDELGISFSFATDSTSPDCLFTAASSVVDSIIANGVNIVTDTGTTAAVFAIGANAGQTMSVSFKDMGSDQLGGTSTISALITNNSCVSTTTLANTLLTNVDEAIKDVSTQRGKFGAAQNRLEHTIKNLDTSAENLVASESRIRDVDMAKEMMEFTKNNILVQAAQSMLAQANQQPQGVLGLLR
jgi:flagellin